MLERHVLLLIFLGLAKTNFYMKVDHIERCVVDSFKKNQEVMIRLEVFNPELNPAYELKVAIKDIEYRYYESEKFVVNNDPKKNLIYNHMSDTNVFVCFQADREMYFKIDIDANIKIPDNLIKADHLHEFENQLYKTLQDMVDYNSKQRDDAKDAKVFEENVTLNNSLMRMTFFECFCVVVMGTIQYLVLRKYIKGNK